MKQGLNDSLKIQVANGQCRGRAGGAERVTQVLRVWVGLGEGKASGEVSDSAVFGEMG